MALILILTRKIFRLKVFFLVVYFVPFYLFGQNCNSIGIRGQKIQIKQSGRSISYTGLAFEFLDPDSKMLEFEEFLSKYLVLTTNDYRNKYGVSALKRVEIQKQAVESHCKYLFYESQKTNSIVLSHSQASQSNPFYTGKSFSDRVEFISKGVEFYGGENLLYSYIELKDFDVYRLEESARKLAYRLVFDEWHNSPGHRANMLNRDYKTIGAAGLIRMKYSRDRFKNCQGIMEDYSEGEPWYTVFAGQVFGL
jgi:uncharacterized protein YkwD